MRLWKVAFALAVVIGLLVPVAAQNLEADLQRAIQRETVSGDLTVAVREHQEIADRSSSNPSVASRALLRLAAASEKAGRAIGRPRPSTNGFCATCTPSQKDAAATAQARLLDLGAATGARKTVARQRWTGPGAQFARSVAPDGRQVVFADAKTGDLAIHDLVTGTDRRLTKVAQPWNDQCGRSGDVTRRPSASAFSWYVGSKGRSGLRLPRERGDPRLIAEGAHRQPGHLVRSAVRVVSRRPVDCRASEAGRRAPRRLRSCRQPRRRVSVTLKTIDWRGVSHTHFLTRRTASRVRPSCERRCAAARPVRSERGRQP